MAGYTREQRAAKKAAQEAEGKNPDPDTSASSVDDQMPTQVAEASPDDWLIAVIKDGVSMRVHPTCLKAHKSLGWKEV